MSIARSSMKKQPIDRNVNEMVPFVWEGTDKRGIKMKGNNLLATRTCSALSFGGRASHL